MLALRPAAGLACLAGVASLTVAGSETPAALHFRREISPLLTQYCGDCHTGEEQRGGISFGTMAPTDALLHNSQLWSKVVANVRSGLMPPGKEPHPTAAEVARLTQWVKTDALGLDPRDPDPGRVTLRRLNRTEYRNTIRDLLGYDFNAESEFPPDDTGYGFDDIGDVLTVSPLLLEKYLAAAKTIVQEAVPTVARVVPERRLAGNKFQRTVTPATNPPAGGRDTFLGFNYYAPGGARATFTVDHAGTYRVTWELAVRGTFDYDPGRCRFQLQLDGQEVVSKELGWYDSKVLKFDCEQKWTAGDHQLSLSLTPLTPESERLNSLELRILSVTFNGPQEPEYWKHPPNYTRFFPREVPAGAAERRSYAAELLRDFAGRAYRRPVEDAQVERLVRLAEGVYSQPGKSFEAGIAAGYTVVLASPNFIFRLEQPATAVSAEVKYPPVDEYSLAARLSYYLWSTTPDAELIHLAAKGELRQNLPAQIRRLLADPRADQLVHNFSGQWLQTRDVGGTVINARTVLARDDGNEKQMREQLAAFRARFAQGNADAAGTNGRSVTNLAQNLALGGGGATNKTAARPPGRFTPPRVELDSELRTAMERETQMFVASVMREDRPVTELIDADYTFVNEKLAKLYGLTNIHGGEMRRVTLPPDSPRGGVLTEGSLLVVTSNPDRTSPVKRGLFVLDNILGTPAPPPPANVPSLEAAEQDIKDHEPTLREALALHREKPLCASCHNRMDPIGLAFENFNALGMYREKERNQVIEPRGKLITGENFTSVRELKHLLVNEHRQDFYRCLTEKMLTYALGRGLEPYDLETVDQIVARLNRENGKFSALVLGVIESAPFQKQRREPNPVGTTAPAKKLALNE